MAPYEVVPSELIATAAVISVEADRIRRTGDRAARAAATTTSVAGDDSLAAVLAALADQLEKALTSLNWEASDTAQAWLDAATVYRDMEQSVRSAVPSVPP